MTTAIPATDTGKRATPRILLGAIAGAWCIAIVAQISGAAELLHHDAVAHADLPLWAGLGVFLLAWQLMVVAMMLPSSLPMIRLFGAVAANQAKPLQARGAFIAGYAAVWTGFGAAAFLGDLGFHRLVDRWSWLATRPQVIAGTVLILAGAFQFSELKERCLRQCQSPVSFLLPRYGRGVGRAFRLGRAHGVYCLGCCWALMLVGFGAGVANLWWMAALTAVMVIEKTTTTGERVVVPVGAALIATGVFLLVVSGGSPEVLGSSTHR